MVQSPRILSQILVVVIRRGDEVGMIENNMEHFAHRGTKTPTCISTDVL